MKSLWGISRILTTNIITFVIYLNDMFLSSIIEITVVDLNIMLHYLLAINVMVYWIGKKGRDVCVFTGHSKLMAFHARYR